MTTPTDPENVTSPTTVGNRQVPLHARAPSTVDAPRLGADASADELVADIEATRADLDDTVDALAHKFDVKVQAQHTVDDAKARAIERARVVRAHGIALFDQAKEAATDDHGNLTAQARSVAVRVGAAIGAVVIVTAVVRRRRQR